MLPFSSWRSWPGCPRCSWVSPPRWRPGQSGTFPGREHREGHSWQGRSDMEIHYRNIKESIYTTPPSQLVRTGKWQTRDTDFFRASLRFLNRPSDDTSFCNLSITVLVWKMDQGQTINASNKKFDWNRLRLHYPQCIWATKGSNTTIFTYDVVFHKIFKHNSVCSNGRVTLKWC